MKRSISQLTTWESFEKKLFKDPAFRKRAQHLEPEYRLAKSIIDLRLAQKLSQAELAEKIGSKQPVISRLESGRSKPTLSLLHRVAEGLDAQVEVTVVKHA
jgi:ribosome-binding protein aMBF1 (putative translation factor)